MSARIIGLDGIYEIDLGNRTFDITPIELYSLFVWPIASDFSHDGRTYVLAETLDGQEVFVLTERQLLTRFTVDGETACDLQVGEDGFIYVLAREGFDSHHRMLVFEQ